MMQGKAEKGRKLQMRDARFGMRKTIIVKILGKLPLKGMVCDCCGS